VQIPVKRWWRQALPLTALTVLLGSIAAVATNVTALKNAYVELSHNPEATLEGDNYSLHAASNAHDQQVDIAIRGDSFFRSRISGVTMRITPDPKFPGTGALSDEAPVTILASNRSLDISEKMTIALPINHIPAGHYRIQLSGTIATGWKPANFMLHAISLEVRPPVSIHLHVIPWQPGSSAQGLYSEALVDIAFLFGRVDDAASTVNVVLKGHWSGFSFVQIPAGAKAEATSQNAPSDAKSIAFLLRYFPSKSFSTESMRIKVSSPSPMAREVSRFCQSLCAAESGLKECVNEGNSQHLLGMEPPLGSCLAAGVNAGRTWRASSAD
jgi:hypothetical protein